MSDLLPPNATAQERALSDATARIGDVPVPLRALWNPDTCPVALLPWLAWALSQDEWDSSWSDAQKRAALRDAIAVQEIKGTIGAVKTALSALGIDARVQEWFSQIPGADPYTYRLLLQASQSPVTQSGIQRVIEVVERTKSLRSHASEIEVTALTAAPLTVGAAAGLGSEIEVRFVPPMVLPHEGVIALPPPLAFPHESVVAVV